MAAFAVAAAFCVLSCVSVTGGHGGDDFSPADSLSVSGWDAAEGWFRESLSRLGRAAGPLVVRLKELVGVGPAEPSGKVACVVEFDGGRAAFIPPLPVNAGGVDGRVAVEVAVNGGGKVVGVGLADDSELVSGEEVEACLQCAWQFRFDIRPPVPVRSEGRLVFVFTR